MLGSSRRMTVARPARPHGARRDAARRAYGRAAAVSSIPHSPACSFARALSLVRAGPGGRFLPERRGAGRGLQTRGGAAAAPARRPGAEGPTLLARVSFASFSSQPSYRPTKPSRPGLSFLAFRRINPLCSLMLHALGCIATYHETTHAVSCPSALEGCMHASSETHAVSECTMFRHTCVAQSPTPFPPYSHP